MPTEVQLPLWPDSSSVHHRTCWNCGLYQRFSITGSATRFMCECGCGWSVRYGVIDEIEKSQVQFRENVAAQQLGMKMVDFTEPGASPAPG